MWDNWDGATFAGKRPFHIAVIGFVGDDGAGRIVGSGVDQVSEQRAVGRLAPG